MNAMRQARVHVRGYNAYKIACKECAWGERVREYRNRGLIEENPIGETNHREIDGKKNREKKEEKKALIRKAFQKANDKEWQCTRQSALQGFSSLVMDIKMSYAIVCGNKNKMVSYLSIAIWYDSVQIIIQITYY